MPRGSPARGAPGDAAPRRREPPATRRALPLGRPVFAPVVLAATTVFAVAGAVLALLPAALRRRPHGRLGPRRADDGTAAGAASEPIAP